MTRLLRSLVMSTIALWLFSLPVLAQTPAASPEATPYTGLVEGVTRQYTPDPKKAPADDPESFVLVSVHLFRFETENAATASWKLLSEDATSPLVDAQEGGEDAPAIRQGAIDDLGDHAWAVSLSTQNTDGETGHYRLLYVQDGEYLIVASAMGGSEENTLLVDDITRAITEHEDGSDPATFSADGTSTGGIWDKLPATGDDDAHGLTAFSDRDVTAPNEE